ncbi:hypothetical protein ACHAXM_007230 [Skeletonema potamos]
MSNIERPAADEEAPLIAPPREISIHQRRHNDEDNYSLPSELSSLVPSTLTPMNYNNPDMHCHESHPSGSSRDSISSRKAFRLAAFLAILSIVVLTCVDVVYFVGLTPSEPDKNVADLQTERSVEAVVKEPKSDKKKNNNKKKKRHKKTDNKKEDAAADDDEEESEVVETERVSDITDGKSVDDAQEVKSQDTDVTNSNVADSSSGGAQKSREVRIPTPEKRCAYVVNTFEEQNKGEERDFLRDKYKIQSSDPNVFYRATALLFWQDFAAGMWGKNQNKSIVFDDLVMLNDATYEDGTPMSPYSAYTWVTGDQHLSNFGAWRNRGKEVVFSINDFDEAAIFDFHIDVLRVAVSIASHGFTNGLTLDQIKGSLEAFTYMYVKTVINYVGNDMALVYELTSQTSTGVLRDFLNDVENKRSKAAQMEKFTDRTPDGVRFTRDDKTRLVDVPAEIDDKIRAAFTSTKYGSSMMKMGWKVRGWDDDFFKIVDIARRLGSGVGSYGVDRFYVLLKGKDELLDEGDDSHVILDVKYEPISAVSRVLDDDTRAWYAAMFQSEADRVAQAQVALTSYTDPYVGYIYIDGASYNVRQRSPYKDSFDGIIDLKDHRVFDEYIEQIAIITATAHVRGTVAKSPGQFKHNIKSLLAGGRNRSRWSNVSVVPIDEVSFFTLVH